MVRRLCLITAWLIGGLLAGPAYADTFNLANGETITGELLMGSENDAGIQIKVGEGKYERVPWANFSQEDLKKLVKVQKLTPLVEPFIEITQEDKIKKTEVNIKQPTRLELPPKGSLVGALFSSGLGLLILLLLYAANIYAGYEISIFRGRPTALVCGVSAALPLIGPIIFLSLPTKLVPVEETWTPAPEAAPEGAAAEAVNPMQAAGAEHPTGLRLAGTEPSDEMKVGAIRRGRAEARHTGDRRLPAGPVHFQPPLHRDEVRRLLRRGSPRRGPGHGAGHQVIAWRVCRPADQPHRRQRSPFAGAARACL